jgi:hypothetical protein
MKKEIPLVTSTVMVDYNLRSKPGSTPSSITQELFRKNLAKYKKDFTRRTTGEPLVQTVELILTNLLNAHAQNYESLVFPTGSKNFKRTRYLPKFLTERIVVKAVQILEDAKIIVKESGTGKIIKVASQLSHTGYNTVQEATRLKLSDELDAGLTAYDDFQIRPNSEVVILKGSKVTPKSSSEFLDYANNSKLGIEVTEKIRPKVRAINEFMAQHEITYLGDVQCNRSASTYSRIFNGGTLDKGGRYFGHWAQTLPRAERKLIRIDGQEVMDLDYQTMFYNLLLYHSGSDEPSQKDAFSIPGYEQYRTQFKKLAYSMLNSTRPLKAFPDGFNKGGWEKGFTMLKGLLVTHLPLLLEYDGSGVGLKLMRMESDIITKACENMIIHNNGFVIMHDGLLVSKNAKYPEGCMREAYRHYLGWDPVITQEYH